MKAEYQHMKIRVKEWLRERPMLPTDSATLKQIVENEEKELEQAIASGQLCKIIAEAGDVYFSRIAADLDTTQITSLIKRIGVNPSEVLRKTESKNKTNYGRLFFQEVSPFGNSRDAIACLRLFRQVYKTPEELNIFWEEVDHYINDEMAFYDQWWVAKRFRECIKRSLRQIRNDGDSGISNTADRLLVLGRWDSVPFVIDDN